MADLTAVYAIRQYKLGINELDAAHLEALKQDFPDAKYVCIMVLHKETADIKEAEKLAEQNGYVIEGPKTGITYSFGPGKGSPPGTGSNL